MSLDNLVIPNSTRKPSEIQGRLITLETELNAELIERGPIVKTALVALISGTHHYQLGSPGIGKSILVERLYKRISGIEGRMFRWLLTKYTTPEELFGPPSLKGLENDEYRRITTNKLPEAVVAFCDEIFKGNSSILNALLTILNERMFFNDGVPMELELTTVFAASNELPQGEELSAMYDRLHFRHYVRPIQDSSNFIRMLDLEIPKNPEPVISWDELKIAQDLVRQITIPSDVKECLKELRDNLRGDGIEPTERRFMDCRNIIRGTAFLNGRSVAEIDDCALLQHVLWDRPEDYKVVKSHVLQLANPLDREAEDILTALEETAKSMDEAITKSDSQKALARQSVEFYSKLNRVKADIKELKKKLDGIGRKSETFEELKARYQAVATTLKTKCFSMDLATDEFEEK